MKNKPRGFVIYKDEAYGRFVCINCIITKSVNEKTGDMAQVSILSLDYKPSVAIRERVDHINCGDCPLRSSKVCYVNPISINKVWESYNSRDAVKCPEITKPIRFGAYGDPAFIPVSVVKQVLSSQPWKKKKWAGYTHQWHKASKVYSKYFMASIDKLMAFQLGLKNTIELKQKANAKGYRTFRILEPHEKPVKDEVLCPYESVKGLTCSTCLLCSGTEGRGSKNVAIYIHGPNNKVQTYLKAG